MTDNSENNQHTKSQMNFQAFFEICGLWGMIAATTYSFFQVNNAAAYLLIPYQIWVTLAGALNYSIWKNNEFDTKDKKENQNYAHFSEDTDL